MKSRPPLSVHPLKAAARGAFTLVEILLAMGAAAVILTAIYGIFSKAVQLRDSATARVREGRVQAHAAGVLRNDLRNALVSGGLLATELTGSRTAPGSSFPGYLKFTTTTARPPEDTDELLTPDLQEVSYYISNDPNAADLTAGRLVRSVRQNLLAPLAEESVEEPLLAGIDAMEVDFYDGQSWQESWEITDEKKTLPEAVRVRIHPATTTLGEAAPAPIEVLVAWTTQSAIDATATTPTPTDPEAPATP